MLPGYVIIRTKSIQTETKPNQAISFKTDASIGQSIFTDITVNIYARISLNK